MQENMILSENISEPNINKINLFDILAIVGNFGSATSVTMALSTAPGTPISEYTLATGEVSKAAVTFV